MKYFRIFAPDIAIDLGTANSLIYVDKEGIKINEPSVVALKVSDGKIAAIGNEAREMIGKTPDNIVEIMPLKQGVINDYDITLLLLEHHFSRAIKGLSLIQARGIITIPSNATDVEMRAMTDACLQAGLRDVYLIEEPLSSAAGAGLPVDKPTGSLLVNLGAGRSEIRLISLYGIVASESLRIAGDSLNNQIYNYIKNNYEIVLGPDTIERAKISIGSLDERKEDKKMEVGGRDLYSGLPKTVVITSLDIRKAVIKSFYKIIDSIKLVLEKTPPELAYTVIKNGITITGGTSKFDGLKEFIEGNLGIKVTLSQNPLTDSVVGAMKVLKNIEDINELRKSRK